MSNRDYFTRPIQSDRMLHDYGNTRLGKVVTDYRRQAGPVRREAWTFLALIAGCGIVWGVAGMVS